MNRKPESILHDIDYWLKVRDSMVERPIYDYSLDGSILNLIIEKLNALGKEYRQYHPDFVWYDYQFTRKDDIDSHSD